jgi:hypothetical protein
MRYRAIQVETDAFSRSHDASRELPHDIPNHELIPHSPDLPGLAADIAAYASISNRTDLGTMPLADLTRDITTVRLKAE